MSLIVGAGGAIGGVGAAGATALWNAGYAAALGELVKLQVSYREVLLRTQLRGYQAAEVIDELVRQRNELKRRLDEERALNDEDSERVTGLKRIEKGYGDAITWMRRQQAGDR